MPIDHNKPTLVVDLETDGLEGDTIWCIGVEDGSSAYLFTPMTAGVFAGSWYRREVRGESGTGVVMAHHTFQHYLSHYTLIFHNAAFDVKVLRKHGFYIEPESYYDTMIMSYVMEPGLDGGHSLGAWGGRCGFPKGEHNDWSRYTEEMGEYCQRDCRLTRRVFNKLKAFFDTDEKAARLLYDVELPFIEAIIAMETTGFYFDKEQAETMLATWSAARHKLQHDNTINGILVPGKEKIYAKGKHTRNGVTQYNHCTLVEFNPNSGDHVAYLVYDRGGVAPPAYTDTGKPSTSAESLAAVAEKVPVAKVLSEMATYTKHIGMVKGYVERLDGRRLFGSFNQAVTLTGRLSSTNPNLQNIPTRGDMGQEIRKLFHAPEDTGYVIVGIDLSNIEGRVLAHYLSKVEGDNRMADTFRAGVDFHQANADAWQVTRSEAKTLLYACLYGAGDTKLGGGSKERGKELRNKLDKNMPALQRLKEKVWGACASRGYVYSAFGRRLVYQGMRSADKGDVARAQRQVFNAMLQGTAADVLKILVNGVMVDLDAFGFNAHLIANVHDEALFYCKQDEADWFAECLTKRFSAPLLSHCPIAGEAKIGHNWYDVH